MAALDPRLADVLAQAGPRSIALQLSDRLEAFVQSSRSAVVLPPMPAATERIVHLVCAHFHLETTGGADAAWDAQADNVTVHRAPNTRIPFPPLRDLVDIVSAATQPVRIKAREQEHDVAPPPPSEGEMRRHQRDAERRRREREREYERARASIFGADRDRDDTRGRGRGRGAGGGAGGPGLGGPARPDGTRGFVKGRGKRA